MIERDRPQLSIRRQAKLLKVNRNRLDPKRGRVSEEDERIMREFDTIHTDLPFYGQRRLRRELRDRTGIRIGRRRARRLMRIMTLDDKGRTVWTTEVDRKARTWAVDPETSRFRRAMNWIFTLLPIEDQL